MYICMVEYLILRFQINAHALFIRQIRCVIEDEKLIPFYWWSYQSSVAQAKFGFGNTNSIRLILVTYVRHLGHMTF